MCTSFTVIKLELHQKHLTKTLTKNFGLTFEAGQMEENMQRPKKT